MGDKRIILLPIGFLIAIVLAWSGWWVYASQFARSQFDGWAEQRRAEGYEISADSLDMGGFPMRVALTADRLRIITPDRKSALFAENVTASFPPWRLDLYDLSSEDTISITSDLVPGSDETPVLIDQLTGLYLRNADHNLQLLATGISGPQGMQIRELGLTGSQPVVPASDRLSPALTGRVELVDGWFPKAFVPGLPDRFTAAVLRFTASGPTPVGNGTPRSMAEVWRDRGGIIDINELAVAWGDLTVRGDGTVTLDDYMRPLASFGLKAGGVAETAQHFEDAGLIDATIRRYISLGVGLLAMGQGQAGVVPVSVTIQDGVLSIGPVAVADVPPIFDGVAAPSPAPASVSADDFPVLAPPPTVSEETLNRQSGNQ